MQIRTHCLRAFVLVAIVGLSGVAAADPPSRVARLGYVTSTVSFSPSGESDWVQATVNRPLGTGDRLWSDDGARAEIQIGGAMVRMNGNTGLSILNLDDQIAQLQLTEGTVNIRVRHLDEAQTFEIDTPNLAFTVRQPGDYRMEVDPDGTATTIVVRHGEGEAYGEDESYVIDSHQPYRFTGTGLREYQYVNAPPLDEFDSWSIDRDRSYDTSVSARYVSPDMVGYQDLDTNGSWRVDANYGNVWVPTHVAVGWAPYRDGHWAWIDPWGWTWVDDAPWGFTVSHYGRWANLGGTWGWVPGPIARRTYYAPALVVFMGGANFQLSISGGNNVGGVAWFPLGPREVYRPAYHVSRGYFENINTSNTVVNNTVINNYYDNSNVTNVTYANRRVRGAVIAVPTKAFEESQSLSRMTVPVSEQALASAPVAELPRVAPTERSVRGAAVQRERPPARVFDRAVVARTAPPAARASFAMQQKQLKAQPGKPLDEVARTELKPAVATAAAPAPVVKVVAQKQKVPPTKRPPPATSTVAAKPGDPHRKAEQQKAAATPAGKAGKVATPPAPEQAASPATPAQPPERNGKPDQRVKHEKPVAPAPEQAASPATAEQPPVQNRKPDQRVKHEKPVAPAPEQAASPATAEQPPVQNRKPDQRVKHEKPVAPAPEQAASPATPEQAPAQNRKPDQRTKHEKPVASAPEQAVSPASPEQAPVQNRKPDQRIKHEKPVAPAPEQAASPTKPEQAPVQNRKPDQRVKHEKPAAPAPDEQATSASPGQPRAQNGKPDQRVKREPANTAGTQDRPSQEVAPANPDPELAAGKSHDKKKKLTEEERRAEQIRQQNGAPSGTPE